MELLRKDELGLLAKVLLMGAAGSVLGEAGGAQRKSKSCMRCMRLKEAMGLQFHHTPWLCSWEKQL